MRSMLRLCVLACVAMLSGPVFAQASGAAPAAAEPSANAAAMDPETARAHEGLRELRATMQAALNARDIDALLARVDDRVVFTTMNGDVAYGKDGIRKYYAEMMEGPGKVVKSVTSDFRSDRLSILHGSDMAIAAGTANDRYELTNGDAFEIKARWSGTMLRGADGRWNVASFHYSADIFDNPILAQQRKILLLLAAGAVLVAAVAGFWFGRRRRKAA